MENKAKRIRQSFWSNYDIKPKMRSQLQLSRVSGNGRDNPIAHIGSRLCYSILFFLLYWLCYKRGLTLNIWDVYQIPVGVDNPIKCEQCNKEPTGSSREYFLFIIQKIIRRIIISLSYRAWWVDLQLNLLNLWKSLAWHACVCFKFFRTMLHRNGLV